MNRVEEQCVKNCNHFSAGGQHPCDPFCLMGFNIYSKKQCPVWKKEHRKTKNG